MNRILFKILFLVITSLISIVSVQAIELAAAPVFITKDNYDKRPVSSQFEVYKANNRKMAARFPEVFPPVAQYQSYVISGKLIFFSGQLPIDQGTLTIIGKLGDNISMWSGQEGARLCMLNILAQLEKILGTVHKVKSCVKITGFVNSTPNFTAQAQIINAASELLVSVLGERKGQHARTVIGVNSLPLGAAVQIDAIFEME